MAIHISVFTLQLLARLGVQQGFSLHRELVVDLDFLGHRIGVPMVSDVQGHRERTIGVDFNQPAHRVGVGPHLRCTTRNEVALPSWPCLAEWGESEPSDRNGVAFFFATYCPVLVLLSEQGLGIVEAWA